MTIKVHLHGPESAPGETIIKPADGPVEHFYIVKQGRVVGERPHSAKGGTETTFEITTGECFPLAALLGERATRTEHRAGEGAPFVPSPQAGRRDPHRRREAGSVAASREMSIATSIQAASKRRSTYGRMPPCR